MKLLDQKMAEMSQLEKADGWDDDLVRYSMAFYILYRAIQGYIGLYRTI